MDPEVIVPRRFLAARQIHRVELEGLARDWILFCNVN